MFGRSYKTILIVLCFTFGCKFSVSFIVQLLDFVEKIRKGENVDVDEYMGNKPRPKPVINPILASSPVKHLAVNTPTHKYNKSPKKKKGDLRYSQFATPSQYTQHPHVFQQQQQLFHQQIPVKQVIQLTTFSLSKTTNLSLNYIAPTPQFIQSVSVFFALWCH